MVLLGNYFCLWRLDSSSCIRCNGFNNWNFKQIQVGSLPKLDPKTAQEGAKRLGAKVFLPSIVLALTSILIAQFTPLGGQVGIGIGAVLSLILAISLTKAPTKQVFKDSQRMVRSVGAPGVLPQLLAMLGVVFTTCGVGKLTANMISHVFPAGNHFLGVALSWVMPLRPLL